MSAIYNVHWNAVDQYQLSVLASGLGKGLQSQSARSPKRARTSSGRGYLHQCSTDNVSPSAEARGGKQVESRATIKLRYSCNGVFCVARQWPVAICSPRLPRGTVCCWPAANGRLYKICGDFVFVILLKSTGNWDKMKTTQTCGATSWTDWYPTWSIKTQWCPVIVVESERRRTWKHCFRHCLVQFVDDHFAT